MLETAPNRVFFRLTPTESMNPEHAYKGADAEVIRRDGGWDRLHAAAAWVHNNYWRPEGKAAYDRVRVDDGEYLCVAPDDIPPCLCETHGQMRREVVSANRNMWLEFNF